MCKQKTRTWCKYENCSLEKLECELEKLNELWTNLEGSWENPDDIEDVYRIYPLLDTTAAIARKMITSPDGKKDSGYKVDVVLPGNNKSVDTSAYRYSGEHKFFNGKNREELLGNIVSTFLHASEYKYMDTRKINDSNNLKIYVFVRTDKLCQSCAKANLENPKKNKINYKKHISHVRYSDCTCGYYVSVRSYIDSLLMLLNNEIDEFEKRSLNTDTLVPVSES